MEKKNFSSVFSGASPMGVYLNQPDNLPFMRLNGAAIDLLESMLELDADKRITAEQTLAHPYLAQYADPSDEPDSPPYDQTFEDFDVSVQEWKGKIRNSKLRSESLNFNALSLLQNTCGKRSPVSNQELIFVDVKLEVAKSSSSFCARGSEAPNLNKFIPKLLDIS